MSEILPPACIDAPCPLCGADAFEPFLTAGDSAFDFPGVFDVVRCRACGMLYTRPQVSPDDIGRFYPADYAAHAPEASATHRRRTRDPWDRLPATGLKRLLDVGCGSGGYLLRRKQAGWSVLGVEPSAAAVEAARAAGLDVVRGVVPGVDLAGRQFDAITLRGVIGCVPRPLGTLATLRGALAPGGTLLVSEHNAGSAAARWFGADWQGWDLPRHYSHFTPQTLRRMIERAGFDGVQIHTRRRTSRWRHSARRKAAGGAWTWRTLAASRNLSSLASLVFGRGESGDELIAAACAE